MTNASWVPFVATNAGLILLLATLVWMKFQRLRQAVEQLPTQLRGEWEQVRKESPAVLIGEVWLKEPLERLERDMREVRVRLEEMERLLLNGKPPPAGSE